MVTIYTLPMTSNSQLISRTSCSTGIVPSLPYPPSPVRTCVMTMDAVMNLVREKPVVIFSKKSCNCMSHTIESLLLSFGANFTVYELDQLPNGNQIERELKATGRKPSLPAVFIGQELVGGVDEVMTLHLGNQLVSLLMRANAIWIWHGKN